MDHSTADRFMVKWLGKQKDKMKNILVAIDFSEVTEEMISRAREEAACHKAKIWLVHVAAPNPDFAGFEAGPKTVRDARAKTLRKEHKRLQQYAMDLNDQGINSEALLIQGRISQTIIAQAAKLQADLIIIGSHGHGLLFSALVGSVCEGVLKHTTIPLLIVPQRK